MSDRRPTLDSIILREQEPVTVVERPAAAARDVITRDECERVHRGIDSGIAKLGAAIDALTTVAVKLQTVVEGLSKDKDNRGSLGRSVVAGVAVSVVGIAVGYAVGKHR